MPKIYFSLSDRQRFYKKVDQSNIFKIGDWDYTNFPYDWSFYASTYDVHFDNILWENCLRECDFEYMKKHDKFLTIDLEAEFFDDLFLNNILNLIRINDLKTSNIEIILQDEEQEKFVKNYFNEKEISDLKLSINNRHIKIVNVPTVKKSKDNQKKFSLLIRRHDLFRFGLLINLFKLEMLDNFHWSYQAIQDHTNQEFGNIIQDKTVLFDDLKKLNFDIDSDIIEFINQIPKRLKVDDLAYDHNADLVYETILNSDFHILTETLFDPPTNGLFGNFPFDVSEKTFKALSCGKPFIAFATHRWLQHFRSLGFKTFHPWIDESYDTIESSKDRMLAIVREIKRLTELDEKSYNHILSLCESIALENKKIFLEKKNQL
jgi:hypothetical protein